MKADGFIANATSGREVDPKRFFRKKIFARPQNIKVERFVEMMRHGHVNYIEIRASQERAVIGIKIFYGRHLLKPVEGQRINITHRDELGANRAIQQGKPATKGARHFSAHEASADDANPNDSSR